MKKIILTFLSISIISLLCVVPSQAQPEKIIFNDYLGKSITLEGKAVNAKMGALLIGDNFSIWIDGLDAWPEGYYQGGDDGKRIKVTGILIEKYDLPVFIPNKGELPVSGIPIPKGTDLKEASHRYLLENAEWELIEK